MGRLPVMESSGGGAKVKEWLEALSLMGTPRKK